MSVSIGDRPLGLDAEYDIATIDVVAQGGDLYRTALHATNVQRTDRSFTDVLEAYFKKHSVVKVPGPGRLLNRTAISQSAQ